MSTFVHEHLFQPDGGNARQQLLGQNHNRAPASCRERHLRSFRDKHNGCMAWTDIQAAERDINAVVANDGRAVSDTAHASPTAQHPDRSHQRSSDPQRNEVSRHGKT